MTGLDYGKWRCKTGTWHGLNETCRCTQPATYLAPGITPTDLPGARAGITYRFRVEHDLSLTLCARLEHDAAPVTKEAA